MLYLHFKTKIKKIEQVEGLFFWTWKIGFFCMEAGRKSKFLKMFTEDEKKYDFGLQCTGADQNERGIWELIISQPAEQSITH